MDTKLYLNIDRLRKELLEIYRQERDSYPSDHRDYLMETLSDETLEELAIEKACEFNDHMRQYLNLKDHRIEGNLKEIFEDFSKSINDPSTYKKITDSISGILDAKKEKFENWWASKYFPKMEEELKNAQTSDDFHKVWKKWDDKHKNLGLMYMDDTKEKLGALSDAVQAASKSHEPIPPRGHNKDYYAEKESQLKEFVAHCMENYWGENDLFEQIAPDYYKQMQNFIEKRFSK